MQVVKVNHFTGEEKEQIVKIWNAEYPATLQYPNIDAFDQYLAKLSLPVHYTITDDQQRLMGWLAVFTRQEERWLVILVDTTQQRKGVGTYLLNQVKQNEVELNGWVIDHNRDKKENGETYYSPLGFYIKNGFNVLSDTRFDNGKLSAVKINWSRNQLQL